MTDAETQMNPKKLMTGHKLRALPILLTCFTYKQAAEEIGIHPSTLVAWMKDADFMAELNRLRAEVLQDTVQRLKSASSLALDILLEGLQDIDLQSRQRCAKTILDYVLKTTQTASTVPEGDLMSFSQWMDWARETQQKVEAEHAKEQ